MGYFWVSHWRASTWRYFLFKISYSHIYHPKLVTLKSGPRFVHMGWGLFTWARVWLRLGHFAQGWVTGPKVWWSLGPRFGHLGKGLVSFAKVWSLGPRFGQLGQGLFTWANVWSLEPRFGHLIQPPLSLPSHLTTAQAPGRSVSRNYPPFIQYHFLQPVETRWRHSRGCQPDLQNADSTGSAEPNFFQLFRQICLVFRKIMSFPCSNYKQQGILFVNFMLIM